MAASIDPATKASNRVVVSNHPSNREYLFLVSFWVTLVYLLAEVTYNVGLVRMLSTPGLTKSTVEGMEVVGKTMASIGITLFISRIFPLRRAWLYCSLVAMTYIGLGIMVDRTIDRLPDSAKHTGHWLGMYRVAALEGRVGDPDLITPGFDPTVGQRMAMVNMAMLKYADKNDVEKVARKYLLVKVSEHINYTDIDRSFDRFWRTYSYASAKLKPVWDWYCAETQKQEHRTPSLAEFSRKVEESNRFGPRMREYSNTVLYKGNQAFGLPPIAARDIPLFLTKDQLRAHFNQLINDGKIKAVDHFAPDTGATATTPAVQLTRDLSSSVFIPPISMSLSLFSIFLNMASLAGIIASYALYECSSPRGEKVAQCVTMAIVIVALAMTSSPPFNPGSKFAAASAHAAEDGFIQRLWIEAINRESFILNSLGKLDTVRAIGDKLPALGRVFVR